jgi:histidinol dehydrogenase
MITIKKINASVAEEREDFFRLLEQRTGETNQRVTETVQGILKTVKEGGDEAVKNYTLQFDGSLPEYYEVPRDVINDALTAADPAFVNALLNSMENVRDFHQRQVEQGFIHPMPNGVILGQRVRGLERVGLYVPGGTAAYPSSVIMNAVPAKIAGVKEIIMVTPPRKDGTPNPDILVAAAICGVDRIFLSGGAQAIAALAYGTEAIPKVDKIVGPGNIYVATAKKLLYGIVDIDMIAGPSEVLVMADKTATPSYVAADLMSQAEHDVLASSILVTTSAELAEQVEAEVNRQVQTLSRKEIIEKSMNNYGAILLCDSREEATQLANRIAPEHLEVLMENPMELLGALDNAGSVFLGPYASEPLGDYYAGPNHVLPTSGTARFFSPLGVASFTKRSSYTYYTRDALKAAKDDIVLIANREGLTAHANAITVRFEAEKGE